MTAVQHRYRRFEMRFRKPETDSTPVSCPFNRENFDTAEMIDPVATATSNDARDTIGDEEHHFVRQPVKILLIPRSRLVR